jgi:thiamine-phosphate pyrophosphorylase
LPVVAIGGLALENVEGVLAAGADGVAVISAIQSAVSPRQAARRLRDVIERRGPARGAHEPGTGGTDV